MSPDPSEPTAAIVRERIVPSVFRLILENKQQVQHVVPESFRNILARRAYAPPLAPELGTLLRSIRGPAETYRPIDALKTQFDQDIFAGLLISKIVTQERTIARNTPINQEFDVSLYFSCFLPGKPPLIKRALKINRLKISKSIDSTFGESQDYIASKLKEDLILSDFDSLKHGILWKTVLPLTKLRSHIDL